MAWDSLRSTYDTVADVYEARFLDELEEKPGDRELLEAFARSVDGPVVEIGCGPGHIGAFAQGCGPSVFGFDLSVAMVGLAAARLCGAVVGDMRALPFGPGCVGGVIAFYSLIHLRRHEVGGVLADLHRMLRPGGSLLAAVHQGEGEVELDEFVGKPVPFVATMFDVDALAAALRGAGFEVTFAEARAPMADETTHRIYVAARKQ